MKLLILLCENCLEAITLKEDEGFQKLYQCPSCGSSSWLWLFPEEVERYRQTIIQMREAKDEPCFTRCSVFEDGRCSKVL